MKQSFEVEKPISDATTTYVVHSAKRAAVAGEHKDFLITKMDHKPAMCNEIVPEICVQKFTPSWYLENGYAINNFCMLSSIQAYCVFESCRKR